MTEMTLNTIEEIIDDIRQGKMVILMDDEDRENEGDLIMAAEQVRAEDINFMATHARGLICLPMSEARCNKLKLPLMVNDNQAAHTTNFTVSIEAAEGVTTGISAGDRARTIRAAVAREAVAEDIVQPGHIFPLIAQPGGVLSRAGHTEAGCDLAQLAGFDPSAVIVEIMNEDGSMARRPDLEKFAREHDLKIGTIADLIHYRSVTEKTVECINTRQVETGFGSFSLKTYRDIARGDLHFAMCLGEVKDAEATLVRVHVHDAARDLFNLERSADEHKPWSIQRSLKHIADQGAGVLVLICHDQSTQEIEESIDWFLAGKKKRTSSEAAYKQVGTGSQILKDLGVSQMRLMSAPMKFSALSGFGLEVVDHIVCDK